MNMKRHLLDFNAQEAKALLQKEAILNMHGQHHRDSMRETKILMNSGVLGKGEEMCQTILFLLLLLGQSLPWCVGRKTKEADFILMLRRSQQLLLLRGGGRAEGLPKVRNLPSQQSWVLAHRRVLEEVLAQVSIRLEA